MRTCTVLWYTDGHKARYIVLRGRMIGTYFDSAGAEIIGHYNTSAPGRADYRSMTRAFATKEAPAVSWQR
jgi:hypothetical protein